MAGIATPRLWTIAVIIAVAHCLLFLNTVGCPGFCNPGPGVNLFGWPLTYAIGSLTETQQHQYDLFFDSREMRASPCDMFSREAKLVSFDKYALAANVLVGIGILVLVSFLVEYRRRLKSQSRTFRLRSLFFLTAIVCVVGAATRSTAVMSFYLDDVCRWRRVYSVISVLVVAWMLVSPWLRYRTRACAIKV